LDPTAAASQPGLSVTTPDGVRLHVEDEGEGNAIVFVHGWCSSTRVWDDLAKALRGKRRVVRYDLRSSGSSRGREGTYDFDHFSDDLAAVIKERGLERPTLVGWSLGVGVVHRFLQRFPQAPISGVVLIDYPVKLVEKRDVPDKVCHALNKKRDVFIEDFVARMLLTNEAKVHDLLAQEMRRTTRDAACRMYRMMGAADEPRDDVFEVPALLVFPERGWFAKSLPDWRMRFPAHEAPSFPSSRHVPHLEEPEAFLEALLDFTQGDVNPGPD
jgi:pimeloyl-ACP methyl ester carboxylesterase